jgi:hypothetical protein
MGICMSEEEKALIKKNKVIDIALRHDHIANTQIIKMLLLGTFFYKIETILFNHKFRCWRMRKKYYLKTNEVRFY